MSIPFIRSLAPEFRVSICHNHSIKKPLAELMSLPIVIQFCSSKTRKSLNRLAQQKLNKDRLDNFMPIKEGDIIAIGLNTGLEIRSPLDGKEAFANIGTML